MTPEFHQQMLQYVKDCSLGFIGGKPQPIGVLLHELQVKIAFTPENFGALLPDAIAARDAAVARFNRTITRADDPFEDEAEDDTEALLEGPSPEQLATAIRLAKAQYDLELEVAAAEAHLTAKKNQLRVVSEMDLPNAMIDAGMRVVVLDNGAKVELKETVVGYVKKEDEETFYEWMEENNFDAIIKRIVSVSFGKGQGETADRLREQILTIFPDVDLADQRNIHHSTFAAWVREQHEAGTLLPDVLKVTELRKTKVTLPKKKEKN